MSQIRRSCVQIPAPTSYLDWVPSAQLFPATTSEQMYWIICTVLYVNMFYSNFYSTLLATQVAGFSASFLCHWNSFNDMPYGKSPHIHAHATHIKAIT